MNLCDVLQCIEISQYIKKELVLSQFGQSELSLNVMRVRLYWRCVTGYKVNYEQHFDDLNRVEVIIHVCDV